MTGNDIAERTGNTFSYGEFVRCCDCHEVYPIDAFMYEPKGCIRIGTDSLTRIHYETNFHLGTPQFCGIKHYIFNMLLLKEIIEM